MLERVSAAPTYDGCLKQVMGILQFAGDTLMQSAWAIGKIIKEAIDNGEEQVVPRLARDIGRSARLLYDMQRLYTQYPELTDLERLRDIEWSSARLITSIDDDKTREKLIDACRGKTVSEVKKMVKDVKQPPPPPEGAEEDDEDEDGPPRPTKAALRFYTRMNGRIQDMTDEMAGYLEKLTEMSEIAHDQSRTSQEDYDAIMETAKLISQYAAALQQTCALYLVPMKDGV